MAKRSRFQFSLLSLLGVMFAAAFFFAWLRVSTEFKFILFGMVIMPAIAIGFAMLAGLMPQPSAGDLRPINVAPVYASLPNGLMRATRWRQTRSLLPAAMIFAAVSGCAVISKANPQSPTWYYTHLGAAAATGLLIAYVFVSRAMKTAQLGDEIVIWESAFHKQELRARYGAFGLIPMLLMQLGQFFVHRDPIPEIAALFIAAIFLLSWLSNGPTGLHERGILVRGQAIRWPALRSRYWVANTDFVVFTTNADAPAIQPLLFHVPLGSRDAVEQALATRLPLAASTEEAWGERSN